LNDKLHQQSSDSQLFWRCSSFRRGKQLEAEGQVNHDLRVSLRLLKLCCYCLLSYDRATLLLWAGSQPSSLTLRPFVGLLDRSWMTDDYCGTTGGMNEWQGKQKYLKKTPPSVAVVITDPTLDFLRSRTRTAAMGSRRLAA
jgi:hypothetical protein